MSSNSDSSNTTFQLDYLNVLVSSNRLTTLDVTSMKWLNHTTAVTDLTVNPCNSDCSALHEVWRGLKHKLKLHCASPRELQGKSWEVMDVFCAPGFVDMNYKSNTSSEVVGPSRPTGYKEKSDVNAKVGGPSVVTTTLTVTGVLMFCAFGGGITLAKVFRRRGRRPRMSEYCDVNAPTATYVTVQSYADVGSRPSYITGPSYTHVRSDSSNATGYA